MHTTDNAEREALFRTRIFSHQLVAFCSTGRTKDEIRNFFSDLSWDTVRRTLAKQVKLETIAPDGDLYRATGKTLEGDLADRIWKAARLIGEFTASDLMLYTGASYSAVRDLLWQWCAGKHIAVAGMGTGRHRIYRMSPDAPLARPVGSNRPGRRA